MPHLLEKRDERQTSVLENWHRTSEQFYLGFSPDITTIKEEVRSSILVICFPDGQGRVKRSERQQSASPSGQWTGRDL